MSKGGQKQTTTTQPPSYALPYLQTGLSESLRQYNGGQQYGSLPGSLGTIAGRLGISTGETGQGGMTGGNVNVNPYQVTANQLVSDRVANGSAPINAASNYVTQALNGGFLNSNPYIDQTFNRAAQATQGQLASQFAGAGRNVDQSQGNRAQQLNDLASQIYGGNYANERQLMQGALGYAQPLGNQAYADASALGGLQRPEDAALNQYLQRVNSGTYGSTSTGTSGGGFSGAGGLGGALIGNMLFPGLGGIIGGGLLGGLF